MTADLHLHRILKAPRALVWRCWTEPELLKPWFCPVPHRTTHAVMDVRPGGQFLTVMEVDGQSHEGDGSYLHVDPGRALVFTDLLLSDWRPVAAPFLGFTAWLTIADHPEGTEYTVLARHRTPEDAERHEAMGFTRGWGTVADQLGAFAARLAS